MVSALDNNDDDDDGSTLGAGAARPLHQEGSSKATAAEGWRTASRSFHQVSALDNYNDDRSTLEAGAAWPLHQEGSSKATAAEGSAWLRQQRF